MRFLALLVILGLSGCATWADKSDTEKQAWILGGAAVLVGVALSKQEDTVNIGQDNCFESQCER